MAAKEMRRLVENAVYGVIHSAYIRLSVMRHRWASQRCVLVRSREGGDTAGTNMFARQARAAGSALPLRPPATRRWR